MIKYPQYINLYIKKYQNHEYCSKFNPSGARVRSGRNTTQYCNSSSTHSGILQTHLQQLVMQTSPIFFLGQAALKYQINHIYFKWRGSLFLPYQTCNGNCTPIHGYRTKEYMGFWIGRV